MEGGGVEGTRREDEMKVEEVDEKYSKSTASHTFFFLTFY